MFFYVKFMFIYVKFMFIYVKITKIKISSLTGYTSLSTKLLQNVNKKTFSKIYKNLRI